VIKAQLSGGVYYVLYIDEDYVERSESSDELVRRNLTRVEEHKGRAVIRSEPMNVELPLPRKKTGDVRTDDPDTF
jgi:hypothetical protein